jgi:hypothetical protein
MTYETAPATVMLASSCACCAKALVDSVSVETGVGPDCRKKHGFGTAQGEVDHTALVVGLAKLSPETNTALVTTWANRSVDAGTVEGAQIMANIATHTIAIEQTGKDVAALTEIVAALGFTKLAARIAKRIGVIVVTEEAGILTIKAPFSEEFNANVRSVPGARWNQETKSRTVPASARRALWAALKKSFPIGMMVQGSRGIAAL